MAARSDRPDERPDEHADARPDGTPAHPSDDDATGRTAGPDPDAPVADDDWASIVAQLGDVETAAESAARGGLDFPVAPGVDSPFDAARVVRPAAGPDTPRDPLASASGRDWDGTSEDDLDAQDGFVPPDPGPVLGGDPLLTMAWFAAAGMPLLLLVILIAWRDAPAALAQAACIVFVLGVAVLVWRMPQRRERQDDDGAVV